MTQQQLAELAGVSVAALRDLEQGRVVRPRASTVRRLGETLGLPGDVIERLLGSGRGSGVRVEVLGPLQVVVNETVRDLGSPKQRALLGLLALSPNTVVSRGELFDMLWGERPPAGATGLLQSRLSRLRRRLCSDSGRSADIVGTPVGYRLAVAEDQHDLLVFRDLVGRARERRDEGDPAEAADLLGAALKLWRGDPVEDLPAVQSHPPAAGLRREWLDAVTEHSRIANELGRYEQALPSLHQAAEADELHEGVHAELIVALAGSGQQAAALTLFDRLRRRLADELGADPGPELTAAYQRVLRQDVARAECAPVSAYRQLPPDISDFCGRQGELRSLYDTVSSSADESTAVVVCSIEGMAGIGKTRLAVHAAHELVSRGWYADLQLYVDLHGHAPVPPADPGVVLASFLRLLGVPGEDVPAGTDERAALYRDRLFDKKALVLLDNAADEEQVLPLLPASPHSLVLITSRRVLALDGTSALTVGAFAPAEAEELLMRVVGRTRVEAEPEAVARVVDLCGRLPLAVALVARRMQSRPQWRFADLAARLAGSGDRVAELAAGTRRLWQVFDLSYRALGAEEQRVFRLLGLHPGEDFSAWSVAALARVERAAARRVLERLADEHLVASVTGDRYRLHDLLGDYARRTARREETEQQNQEAVRRVLDYYLHTTVRAIQTVQPRKVRFHLIGVPPAHGPELETREQAEEWLESERACIIAAVSRAAEAGLSTHAWQLANALWSFLMLYGYNECWARSHRIGLDAATRAGDHLGQAVMFTWLGAVDIIEGRVEEAFDHLGKSLALQHGLDDDLDIVTLFWMGLLHHRVGRYDEAVDFTRRSIRIAATLFPHRVVCEEIDADYVINANRDMEQALARYQRGRQNNDLAMEGRALADMCDACRRLNMINDALDWGERAVAIAAELRSRSLETYAGDRLRVLYRELGRTGEPGEVHIRRMSRVDGSGVP